jgi:hypothetical protein
MTIDCTQYSTLLVQELNKTPGTTSVEVRCSLPAEQLTPGVLDLIKTEIDKNLFEENIQVDSVHFAKESMDKGSKDFFIKISKVV